MATMEVDDAASKAKENDWFQLDDSKRPFDAVCEELASLGALSVDDFLTNAASTSVAYDMSFLHIPEPESADKEKEGENENDQDKDNETGLDATDEAEPSKETPVKKPTNYVSLLRQASQNVFGTADCLNWEYMETVEPISKQCILTITRPSGATRSYKSDTGFARRAEAKAQAAQIAVDMGAIDFIVSGDSDALKAKKGLLLNPFDVEIDSAEADEMPATGPVPRWNLGEEPLKKIEDCCQEWRLGKVKPHWVLYNDMKNKKKHGAALRISLNAHVFRSYSTDPVHNSVRAAKIACAKLAIDEGVIDFIQFGNGQTEAPKPVDDGLEDMHNGSRDTPPLRTKGITLQDFYDTLPQPFPEDVGSASAAEINAPAWLNVTLQSARGGRLVSSFTPVVDGIHKLHGCILRIERPEETRTYLVDPQFPKRSDAKSAVCLLAMSQGVGDYIRGLKEATENKLPADKRKLANEKVIQVLAAECGKIRQGNRLVFNFTSERDAFGCILKADLSANPDEPDVREYSVKSEYRTKADAKAAVAYHAAEQGLVDLLRFKGAPPPADYVPFWEAQINGDGDNYVPKRKEAERDVDGESRNPRKRKKGNNGNGSEQGESSLQPPRKLKKPPIDLPPKPQTVMPPDDFPQSNARWKKPYATGSRGLGPANAYAGAARSVGQDRSGNRSGGISRHPHQSYRPLDSPAMTSSHAHVPPHARPYDDRMGYRPEPGYQAAPGYSHPDPYGNGYPPPYPPPPAQGHYPGTMYHSPPPPLPPPPPPPQHYAGYYGAPPPAPSTPQHAPYGHYPYPHPTHYPSPYSPPAPYPGPYSPHPPHHAVMYSPPPPAPMAPPLPHTPHSHIYSHQPVDYRPRHPSHSPPPLPPSPPRYTHHISYPSHPVDINQYETGQQTSNRRRHSTTADFRDNWYPPRAPDGTPPPPPPQGEPPMENGKGWQSSDRPHTYSSQTNPSPAPNVAERSVKNATEMVSKTHTPTNTIPQSEPPTTQQPSLLALYEFCEQQNIAKPAFFSQIIEGKDEGGKKYAVWATKNSQRLELPNHFATVEEGYEKLAKRVLAWERQKLAG